MKIRKERKIKKYRAEIAENAEEKSIQIGLIEITNGLLYISKGYPCIFFFGVDIKNADTHSQCRNCPV